MLARTQQNAKAAGWLVSGGWVTRPSWALSSRAAGSAGGSDYAGYSLGPTLARYSLVKAERECSCLII
jgi:hypothetical protein